ncbi:MAG: YdcH family protein [Candidatus Aminicenantes bacterium]|nr:YdcH family protein [Candidatus Aminicenantes bacterium]
MEDQRIKEILIEKDDGFRRLFIEHQEFQQQLDDLFGTESSSEVLQIRVRNLKKRKLQLKDAMQRMIIAYRRRIESSPGKRS